MMREIPFPSVVVIKFMNVIYAGVQILMKPLGLAPASVAFLTGGLFGLLLLPVTIIYVLLHILREYIHGLLHDAIVYLLWGFVAWYLFTLATDNAHTRVDDVCFRTPQDSLDRIAYDFFKELFDYFPIICVPYSEKVKEKLASSNDKQYVMGVHPHGIHCFPLALFSSPDTPFDRMFPGHVYGSSTPPKHPLTGLCASVMFKIPVVREFFLVFGYIDASRWVADKALQSGKSIFVVTGGEEESMYATQSTTTKGGREDILVLKNRKGFVRLALKHGASLLPVFGVGNNDTFERYTFMIGFRMWIQKTLKIALPIFHGRFITPLPYKVPLKVIIGEPIDVPNPADTNAKPDEKLVDEYHQKYIEALKDMHAKFADRPLRIV